MKQKLLLDMLSSTIQELRANGQWGTAHVYRSARNSFSAFNNDRDIPFGKLTPNLLKNFEIYLRQRRCSWNTISTYMKVLRATYNRAVDNGYALYVPRLFRHVHTSVSADQRRALDASDIGNLLCEAEKTPVYNTLPVDLQKTKILFALMFLLRGIPFVDLVYLRKTDIQGNILRYRRRKTGRPLTVMLTPDALRLVQLVANKDMDSPYLFSFLSSPEGTEMAYHEYQSALRAFNHRLSILKKYVRSHAHLSTYTVRHTWATMAYYCEIHPGIISEAMGHSSIKVTETYLKPFQNQKIDEANQEVISFVKGYASVL
ncbi:tyrosine-type recombinase/integrase [Bacteroides stercorirosoris]|uniref:Phage integrase family protein n=1 Tax=Bacteroides stercorirosoris TaxID=871324 RepID=A0A1M6B9Q0_9BACE|nr:site-specific integrase [Bacteroides stercorirosoris]SHI45193.1 Phage integrase family protein [Bacteroides stercorirosoris]